GAGKVKGEYSDPPHLSKHLKKCHPGDTLNYKCSECNFKAKGKYPYKDVKAHYTTCHVSPAVDAAGPSTREVVRLPVKSTTKAGVQNAAKPVRAPSHPPQRTSPEAGGSRPPVTNRKSGEGAIKKLPANKEHPISTRTRRATSVPAENLPPTTRGSPAGSPGEILISISPATSLPTTLTTCTVTTTTCGSPITSTGFTDGVGRQLTPPACLPQRNVLPTIGEERTSPCVAVTTPPMGGFRTSPLIQPGPSTPAPERGLEERRQEGAATPITEGDNQWGGQWTVSVGRRAKRRQQLHDRSPSNSESPPTAGPSRSPRIAPLCALIAASTNLHENSLNLSRMDNNNCLEKTPPRNVLPVGAERRRRETSPEDRAGGDVGHGAGTRVSAERPSAPVYTRGVMSRRGAAASPTVPPRADRG
ncbi:hypothetical protein ALC57_07554, partial [Trachymyrmex cornetzi]